MLSASTVEEVKSAARRQKEFNDEKIRLRDINITLKNTIALRAKEAEEKIKNAKASADLAAEEKAALEALAKAKAGAALEFATFGQKQKALDLDLILEKDHKEKVDKITQEARDYRDKLNKDANKKAFEENKIAKELRLESLTSEFDVEREVLQEKTNQRLIDIAGNELLENQIKAQASEERKAISQREREFIAQQELLKQQAVAVGVASIVGSLASLNSAAKGNAKITQGLAIGEATIAGLVAIQRAWATPPPANIPLAIGTGIKTAANVAAIASQTFQTPADTMRTVPGPSNQKTLIPAHGGEKIGRGSGGGMNVTINTGVGDPDAIGEAVYRDRKSVV